MVECNECGLYIAGEDRCYAQGRKAMGTGECLYFIKKEYDGGELLTPEQHWLLKLTELRYKQ